MPRKFHQSKKAVEPDRQENLFDYDYEIDEDFEEI